MAKELAGNFILGKMVVKTKHYSAGSSRTFLNIEVNPIDAPKLTAISLLPEVNLEMDLFVQETETLGKTAQ